MFIEKSDRGGARILTITQERIDMAVSRQFKEELSAAIEDKPALVILDLSRVEYLDSSALGTLVAFLREMKQYGGILRLCCLSSALMTLMSLSKLDSMFTMADSVEEALKA